LAQEEEAAYEAANFEKSCVHRRLYPAMAQAAPRLPCSRQCRRIAFRALPLLLGAAATVDVLSFVPLPVLRQRIDASLSEVSGGVAAGRTRPISGAASREGTGGLSSTLLCAAAALAMGFSGRNGVRGSSRTKCRLFGGNTKKENKELTEAEKAALERLEAEIEEIQAQLEEKTAAYERLELELKNYRTRTAKELSAARGKAAIPIYEELLTIADDYDRAKQNIALETDGEKAIGERFEKVYETMIAAWKEGGVEKLESVGQDFNPELHEAISMIPNPEYKEDVVCAEMRAGWVMKTKGSEEPLVLRPALVCVSSGPP